MLQDEREEFRRLCIQNERIYNMLKFPNDGGKIEAMVWVCAL